MAKVIYFTAGELPTTDEKAEIAALNAFAVAPFEVVVRNGAAMALAVAPFEETDYVAGTPPSTVPTGATQYNDMPAFDPASPPESGLPGTIALVADEQELIIAGDGTYVFTVVDGAITAIDYTAEV